jgi:two-component system response regulator HydG
MACDEHQDAVQLRKVKSAVDGAPGDSSPQVKPVAFESKVVEARGGKILPLAEVEKQTILSALERLNGNKLLTARALGIGKTTLYRKLKEYGLYAS